jgi:hypothetical protein
MGGGNPPRLVRLMALWNELMIEYRTNALGLADSNKSLSTFAAAFGFLSA